MSKIAIDSIKYLVFEGGGAKGFAYLGVLRAFAEPHVQVLTEFEPGEFFLNTNKISSECN